MKRCCLVLTAIIFSLSASAVSAQVKFPSGCRDLGHAFQYGDLILDPSYAKTSQTLFFIYNTSGHDILIRKEPKQKYIPSYSNVVHLGEWGSFAMDLRQLKLSCNVVYSFNPKDLREPKEVSPVDCSSVLKVCEYNNAKFAEHNKGSYWVMQSNTLKKSILGSIQSGILLRS